MARYRRRTAPGSIQHIVSRFVNREFRLDADGARQEYLDRAGRTLPRSDWGAIAYALMSSHVHWAMRAGSDPSERLIKPLHSGFAQWFNATQGSLGPVFADRHRTLTFEGPTAAALVAYIHNNPVRAGLVSDPSESSWTSHRAYLGLESAPPWLDVELGLHLCGFAATPAGRRAFHGMVLASRQMPRSVALSGGDLHARRSHARASANAPVEISCPTVAQENGRLRVVAPVVPHVDCAIRTRWPGSATLVLDAASADGGVTVTRVRSRSREQVVSNARRLALLAWTRELQRPAVEMARLLGISNSSAAELIATASQSVSARAKVLAEKLRAEESWDGLLAVTDSVGRVSEFPNTVP